MWIVSSSTTAGHLLLLLLLPPEQKNDGCFSSSPWGAANWPSAHSSFITRCFYFPVSSEFFVLLPLARSLFLFPVSSGFKLCLDFLFLSLSVPFWVGVFNSPPSPYPHFFHASIFIFTRIWSMLFANSCLIMLLLAKMKSWGYFVAFDACGWGCFDKASRLHGKSKKEKDEISQWNWTPH